jgi:hypothetical protein
MDPATLDRLTAELRSELDRRRISYERTELRSWVTSAVAGEFVWNVRDVKDLADRWQSVASRNWWEDAG